MLPDFTGKVGVPLQRGLMDNRLTHRSSTFRAVVCLWTAVLCILFSVLPAYATESDYDPSMPQYLSEDDLTCSAAIVIEADSGDVVFEKNADAIMYPASTTKIMTVYLGTLMDNLDTPYTVTSTALDVPEDSTTIPLAIGEEVTLRDLLYATIVKSGNEGANAIAEIVSGSIPAFVDLMNNYAQLLGCTNTHFNNAHGYHDENHYTTARDMAIIARAAMQNDLFRDIVSTTSYVMPADNIYKERKLTIDNPFLRQGQNSELYYSYGIGIKTGTHNAAGRCFVGAAEKDGVTLISVVFHATSDTSRYTDTIKLLEYGFSQYTRIDIETLYAMNPFVVDIAYYSSDDANLGKLTLSLKEISSEGADTFTASAENIDYLSRHLSDITVTEYTRAFTAPVEQGEVMGTLTYYNANREATVYELVASRSIKRRDKIAPTLEDIAAYTEADPNPFPRFTFEFALLYIVCPILVIFLIIKLLRRLFKKDKHNKKPKVHTVEPTERYYR